MSKSRVILITTSFPYGSGENFIEPELEAIPSGIEVEIVPTQPTRKDMYRTVPAGVSVNNECCVSSSTGVRLKYLLKAFLSKSFPNECKHQFPKSISNMKLVLGYIGRSMEISDKLEKSYRREIEEGGITFYSYWLLEGAHAIGYLKSKYGNLLKTVSRAHGVDVYDGRSVYGTVPCRDYILQYIDRVYVCSKEGKDYLSQKHTEHKEKFVCGYLGTKDLSHTLYDKCKERFVIASCARLVELKRVHLLVKALSLITDRKIQWVHMGDGPERATVEKAIEGLPQNVTATLMGNTKHDEVMRFYQENRVNLFVNTSTTEGLPVSVMEAISFGIPVIATDVGGTSEIVTDSTGVLIPANFSVEELASHIKNYIDMDCEKYSGARMRTREFWEQNFSASKNYAVFYREITER